MKFIRNFLDKEVYYFQKLHSDGQKLLFSIFLYNLVGPLFSLFLNAFLWRESHDLILVAFYNLIFYLFIPFAFYLNGWLLRIFSPGRLYFFSLLIEGLTIASIIFFNHISYGTLFFFASITGVTAGIYWANRNLLTLKTTESNNRIYFSSIESSSGTLTDVIVPLFIGWFITFGTIIHLYSPIKGYQIISIIMLLIISTIAIIVRTLSLKRYDIGKLWLTKTSKDWKNFQAIQFVWGLTSGIATFIPALLILILVGKEETLGTVQSLSSVLTSVLLFALAKYLDIHHRIPLILSSTILLIVGSVTFGLLYSAIGVVVFVACLALSQSLEWVGFSSLNYDLIDEDGEGKKDHYAYVCDQEIYLNSGRAISILLFIALIHFGSKEMALRFAPIIVALLQFFAYLFARSIDLQKTKRKAASALTPDMLQ